jgi:phosphoribosylaminoimidazolecarboxamide formyltransferase/IMP cyclohydrolase
LDIKIERALISVSNKKGIIEFAKALEVFGVELISTGGTYKTLKDAGIKVIKVDEITGFPEMLDGRVKTLHPFIHGGILANREIPSHMEQIEKAGIKKIDMVVVNLYPFKETISKPDVKIEEAIENIDIGGPTMIRSAAKNSSSVAVITDPEDYSIIIAELQKNDGKLSKNTLFSLGVKAFKHTCEYDSYIFNYFIQKVSILGNKDIEIEPFLNISNTKFEVISSSEINKLKNPEGDFLQNLNLVLEKKQNLRYGENPHQKASYYSFIKASENSFVNAKQLQGKELSYNNILDGHAAFNIVKEFDNPCVAIIKHNNPCGCALGNDIADAYKKAYEADSVSAYGSVVASNYKWTKEATKFLMDKYVEVLISPDFDSNSLKLLESKQNLRVLKINFNLKEYLERLRKNDLSIIYPDIKSVDGGLLIQDADLGIDNTGDMRVVTKKSPSEKEWKDLLFGWQVIKNVKSNAILVVQDETTIGVGAGQMSRIDSTKIAVEKAGKKSNGSIIASDAFFPFADAIEIAAKAGITSIIQPGGSIRDEEVIEACNNYQISMIFTGKRHFKH